MNEGLEGGTGGGRRYRVGRRDVWGWEGGTGVVGRRYKGGGVWSICIVYTQEVV